MMPRSRTVAYCFGLVCLATLISSTSWASHVVGGNLEMNLLNRTPGRFTVALNLYFDEINQNVGGVPDADALIYVYRKRDNKRITSFYLQYKSRSPIVYANQTCATVRQIKTTLYRYEQIVNWKPEDYDDLGGYYMTWQYCCRNGDIDNIRQPGQTGQTFYLEFPALRQAEKPFINSSPVFDQVDGEYLCVGEPFRFSFDAKDADNDALRYSLATPYDRLDPDLGIGSRNGTTIQWLPGYGPDNAIPGNPTLTINNQTGELSVTATRQGLFVFTVVVEEYRNGKVIGLVRRDYQFFAVECPPTIPPDPTITSNGQSLTAIEFCEGKTADLKATISPNWEYQWQKDGRNIVGATKPTLPVRESGSYQLTTSLKAQCSKARRSMAIKVTVTSSRFKLKSSTPHYLCGSTGLVTLDAVASSTLSHQWYMDGNLLSEASNSLKVRQPGRYWTIAKDGVQGCTSSSDTVVVESAPLPPAIITPQRNTTVICQGDSLSLSTGTNAAYTYQWFLDKVPLIKGVANQFVANKEGQYKVTVTDTTGCQNTAVPYSLSVATSIVNVIEPISVICGLASSPVVLKALPTGGVFSGPGVTGNQFDPRQAGVGRHTIIYTMNANLTCQAGVAQRIAIVSDPMVSLVPDRNVTTICSSDSLILTAKTSLLSSTNQYTWTVDGVPIQADQRLRISQSGTYLVSILDSNGCRAISQPYSVSVVRAVQVTMDSLPPFCGTQHSPVLLKGYPLGGMFSGPGVVNNLYDPQVAGVGTHTLSYIIKSDLSCQSGVATRTNNIRALPMVNAGSDQEIKRGSLIRLQPDTDINIYRYQWSPVTSLNDPFIASPEANPDKTTTYRLQVVNEYGCVNTDSITISVYEPIWIPDSFSPNGDGTNDEWELRGIGNYPDAEVTVFNRWGEAIFYSQGYRIAFDGQHQGNSLPAGVYTYQIKISSGRRPLSGTVIIIR